MWFSKGKIIRIILCLSAFYSQAQYSPQYSQYMFNGLAINPAYAGSREVLNLAVLYRSNQWGKSVEGAPVTKTFAGDFPLRNPQIALGVLALNDQIGAVGQSGAYLAYAFRVPTEEGKLSFGLQAGFDLLREKGSDIYVLQKSDPMFADGTYRSFMPNAGAGVYYHTPTYFAGLSVPRFLEYTPNTADSYKGKVSVTNAMLYGGAIFPSGGNLKIKPSALLQHVRNGFLFDVNCNVLLMDDLLELGVSYRSSNTLVGMVQIRFYSQFVLGYAYDHALGKPNMINTSHEIMLRYDLLIKVKAASPLYLK